MDREELLLRDLEKIQANNELMQLKVDLDNQIMLNDELRKRYKEKFTELMQSNTILAQEKAELASQVETLQNTFSKLPRFVVKIFLKKDIKMLSEGNNNEKRD